MGIVLRHPDGDPDVAPRLDPARAEAVAWFDYVSIGVPSKEAIEKLAARLTSLGESNDGCTSRRSAGYCRNCTTLTGTRCASTSPLPTASRQLTA